MYVPQHLKGKTSSMRSESLGITDLGDFIAPFLSVCLCDHLVSGEHL